MVLELCPTKSGHQQHIWHNQPDSMSADHHVHINFWGGSAFPSEAPTNLTAHQLSLINLDLILCWSQAALACLICTLDLLTQLVQKMLWPEARSTYIRLTEDPSAQQCFLVDGEVRFHCLLRRIYIFWHNYYHHSIYFHYPLSFTWYFGLPFVTFVPLPPSSLENCFPLTLA